MIPDSLPNESMAKVGHFWLCKNSAGIFTVPKTRPTVYHMSLEVCMKVYMACLKLLFNNFIITAVLGESVRHLLTSNHVLGCSVLVLEEHGNYDGQCELDGEETFAR